MTQPQGQEISSSSSGQEKAVQEAYAAADKITFSFAESLAVKAVLLLGLPDIMFRAESAMTVTEIAEHLSPAPAPPPKGMDVLHRIMRFLAATNFFTAKHSDGDAETRYGLSAAAKCFVQLPGVASRRDLFVMTNDEVVYGGWHRLHECVMGGGQAFVRAHGMELWKYAATDSRFNDLFNNAMAATAGIVTTSLLSSYEGFRHVSSLLDIAGGTGTLAEQIVERHPNITSAINFDLPHVIATAPERKGVEHRAGDMFKGVASAECMVLKFILHDWNDCDCVRILKACKAALPPNGHVVIVDVVLPPVNADADADADGNTEKFNSVMGLSLDLLMLANMDGGRERTEAEFREVLLAAGFSNMKILPLPPPAFPLNCVIEAFP